MRSVEDKCRTANVRYNGQQAGKRHWEQGEAKVRLILLGRVCSLLRCRLCWCNVRLGDIDRCQQVNCYKRRWEEALSCPRHWATQYSRWMAGD